jgi:hypothetical protein
MRYAIILLLLYALYAGTNERIVGNNLVTSGITVTIIIPDRNRVRRAASDSDSIFQLLKANPTTDTTGKLFDKKPDSIKRDRIESLYPLPEIK